MWRRPSPLSFGLRAVSLPAFWSHAFLPDVLLSRLGVRQPEFLFLPYYPFIDGVIDKYALRFALVLII